MCSESGADDANLNPGHSLWLKEAAAFSLGPAAALLWSTADSEGTCSPSVSREIFSEAMLCPGYEARAAALRAVHQQVL